MNPVHYALDAIRRRAEEARASALLRWQRAGAAPRLEEWIEPFARAGRLTINFHPDRIARSGRSVAEGLLIEGRYQSQWRTGISNGSRSAFAGGDRGRWERLLFDGAYEGSDPSEREGPIYGALDLLKDPHGGSPRFGSSYLVLRPELRGRTSFCVGDSHQGPAEVGMSDAPWALLASLLEQAERGALLARPLGTAALFEALAGRYSAPGPSRELDGYLEAQIHGGLALDQDVEAIVLDPSFRGTDVEAALATAAERYGFALRFHRGSTISVEQIPGDFRGPSMPSLGRQVARDGQVDARAIGLAAQAVTLESPRPEGDPPESALQQLKYLWHTVLARGRDAEDEP